MKWVYLALCVPGTILPWSQFWLWLVESELSLSLFLHEAFGQRISAFAWLDLIVSAAVVLTFVVVQGRRDGIKHLWAPFVAMVVVGVSLALPLFLYQRECRLEQRAADGHANLG